MDRDNSYLFYLSGFFSLAFFLLILFTVLILSMNRSHQMVYALKKENFISISMQTFEEPKKAHATKVLKQSENLVNKKNQLVDPSTLKEMSVDDLFSDVWTKKIKKNNPIKKSIDSKRVTEIAKQIEIPEEIATISSDAISQTSTKSNDSSAGNEVNEYLAKIQAIIYENFFPPQNSQGYSVKAVVELDSFGKVLDFRILNYSLSQNLNSEADMVKDRIKNILFPVSPSGNGGSYIILLTSKE